MVNAQAADVRHSVRCQRLQAPESDLACHRLGHKIDQTAANGLPVDSFPRCGLCEAVVADSAEVPGLTVWVVKSVVAKVAALLPRGRIAQIVPRPEATGFVAVTERLARGRIISAAGEMAVHTRPIMRCVMNQVRAGFDRPAGTFRDLWDGLVPETLAVLARAGREREPFLCGLLPVINRVRADALTVCEVLTNNHRIDRHRRRKRQHQRRTPTRDSASRRLVGYRPQQRTQVLAESGHVLDQPCRDQTVGTRRRVDRVDLRIR